MSDHGRRPGRFVHRIRLAPTAPSSEYPFDLPVVAGLLRGGGLGLPPGVTFLVGENGSGKSTVVEALAVAVGLNPEGGSRNFRFATRSSESHLGQHLIVTRGTTKPRDGFFLRAESYYNVASEIERLDRIGRPLLPAYGGVSPHARSHGESFIDLITHRFGRDGFYVLDEPEAALSVRGCLALLSLLGDLRDRGCQLVIATHSPLLLALPGAAILQIDDDGAVEAVDYDHALPVRMTRDFLADPQRYLRHLFDEP